MAAYNEEEDGCCKYNSPGPLKNVLQKGLYKCEHSDLQNTS